jgi:ribonuclease HI
MDEQEFQKWKSMQKTSILFFDGASKENIGVGGHSRSRRKIGNDFFLGLGESMNNQVEAYALL